MSHTAPPPVAPAYSVSLQLPVRAEERFFALELFGDRPPGADTVLAEAIQQATDGARARVVDGVVEGSWPNARASELASAIVRTMDRAQFSRVCSVLCAGGTEGRVVSGGWDADEFASLALALDRSWVGLADSDALGTAALMTSSGLSHAWEGGSIAARWTSRSAGELFLLPPNAGTHERALAVEMAIVRAHASSSCISATVALRVQYRRMCPPIAPEDGASSRAYLLPTLAPVRVLFDGSEWAAAMPAARSRGYSLWRDGTPGTASVRPGSGSDGGAALTVEHAPSLPGPRALAYVGDATLAVPHVPRTQVVPRSAVLASVPVLRAASRRDRREMAAQVQAALGQFAVVGAVSEHSTLLPELPSWPSAAPPPDPEWIMSDEEAARRRLDAAQRTHGPRAATAKERIAAARTWFRSARQLAAEDAAV